jgi:hypothetical protein
VVSSSVEGRRGLGGSGCPLTKRGNCSEYSMKIFGGFQVNFREFIDVIIITLGSFFEF